MLKNSKNKKEYKKAVDNILVNIKTAYTPTGWPTLDRDIKLIEVRAKRDSSEQLINYFIELVKNNKEEKNSLKI